MFRKMYAGIAKRMYKMLKIALLKILSWNLPIFGATVIANITS